MPKIKPEIPSDPAHSTSCLRLTTLGDAVYANYPLLVPLAATARTDRNPILLIKIPGSPLLTTHPRNIILLPSPSLSYIL